MAPTDLAGGKRRITAGPAADLLNLSNPEAIRKIHREYLEAAVK